MNIKTISILLLVPFVILSACAPITSVESVTATVIPQTATEKPNVAATSIPSTATSIAAEEPTVTKYYPLSTRTDIADVDEVLAAVESGDVQALRNLIRFTTIGCAKAEGMGGPPKCREGEAEGTLVNVLPLLGPEGSFVHESDLSTFAPMKALGIFAVYSVSDSAYSEDAYPAGEYAAVFTTAEDQIFVIYQIRKGIVRMDTVFSPASRDVVIQRDALKLILAPK